MDNSTVSGAGRWLDPNVYKMNPRKMKKACPIANNTLMPGWPKGFNGDHPFTGAF
jgi:hypothetical protein